MQDNAARKTRKRVSPPGPTLPREFTPTAEELDHAMAVLRAGLANGTAPSQREEVESPTEQRAQVHAIGPGALATGHGLAGGGRQGNGGVIAYLQFVDAVASYVGKMTWDRVEILDQAAWVQIKGNRGKVYIAKTTGVVSRIESTLEPEEVPRIPEAPPGAVNASEPDRPNGRIRSWLRADAELVAEAVKVIAGPSPAAG